MKMISRSDGVAEIISRRKEDATLGSGRVIKPRGQAIHCLYTCDLEQSLGRSCAYWTTGIINSTKPPPRILLDSRCCLRVEVEENLFVGPIGCPAGSG